MKSKILLSAALLSISLGAFADGAGITKWSCSFNDQKSAIKLAQILNAHPKKMGGFDDAGLHMETDLANFELSLKGDQVVGGTFLDSRGEKFTGFLDLEGIIQKSLKGEKDEYTSVRIEKKAKTGTIVHFTEIGRDNFHYAFQLQPKLKQILLNYEEQQDCSDAYASMAIYDCKISE